VVDFILQAKLRREKLYGVQVSIPKSSTGYRRHLTLYDLFDSKSKMVYKDLSTQRPMFSSLMCMSLKLIKDAQVWNVLEVLIKDTFGVRRHGRFTQTPNIAMSSQLSERDSGSGVLLLGIQIIWLFSKNSEI
jgi:hypothetical protein